MSGVAIHATAIVDSAADLDSTVEVGPYAVIGPGVRIGPRCRVGAHCVIDGPTTIGPDNVFHPFARIGGAPQDKKYDGEPTTLVIGARNMFREYVTLNRGTAQDRGETSIGDDNWVMAYVHVAHDCVVGNQVIMANTTNLAGHVHVGDHVVLGGYTGVHQFCKIGAHAMTAVGTVVLHDIPPFVMASGDAAQAHGINSEGLRRRGFDAERVAAIKRAYKVIYKRGLKLDEARAELSTMAAGGGAGAEDCALLLAFLGQVTRGIVR
ncbi:MAG: acyl-ACP--UDP-N-acetylglucosamine O-acyltransferase [Burkholderiaceae bacterium]